MDKEEKSIYIRKSTKSDLEYILKIFDSARKYMRANKNFSQWSENYPGEADILLDMENGNSYVGVDSSGGIVMTFAFIIGEDPTYLNIREGDWLNNENYGTIHRIASNGKVRGMLKEACDYCFQKIDNIRIDTHEDNTPMLAALVNLRFKKCGIIDCRDGSPRIAFQKSKS